MDKAYEKWNVEIGLNCGFSGLAQIGKGMWAMPDMMSKMMKEKDCPLSIWSKYCLGSFAYKQHSHALHYHKVDVMSLQKKILEKKCFN